MKIRILTMLLLLPLAAAAAFSQTNSAADRSDDEMKLLALNGLREADHGVAVAQIEKVLAGDSSLTIKRKAVQILADLDTVQARDLLARIARGQTAAPLQSEAIRRLGNCGDATSLKALSETYDASTDIAIKRQILNAFRMADDGAHLLAAAKNEKSPELRAEAIHQLGLVGASDALSQLYQGESSTELKALMIRAFGHADDYSELERIARSEAAPDLRRAAISQLGHMDSERSATALVTLYSSEKETPVRKEIIHSLFAQDNAKALIEIARKETNQELKLYAVERLSHMDSKDAVAFLTEILSR